MIQFPKLCQKCTTFLNALAAGGGGIAFCDHIGGGHADGVGVYISLAAAPDPQMQIIYPISREAATAMATAIMTVANEVTMPTTRKRRTHNLRQNPTGPFMNGHIAD